MVSLEQFHGPVSLTGRGMYCQRMNCPTGLCCLFIWQLGGGNCSWCCAASKLPQNFITEMGISGSQERECNCETQT